MFWEMELFKKLLIFQEGTLQAHKIEKSHSKIFFFIIWEKL